MIKQVLFHVDETDKWEHAVNNVRNMIAFYQEQKVAIKIEVLINGEAVSVVLQKDAREAIGKLAEKGVAVAVCNNALKSLGIKSEQVPGNTTIVPAGVVELAERQFEGYAYIKP